MGEGVEEEMSGSGESETVNVVRIGALDGVKGWMQKVELTEGEILIQLKKMKNGKQGGIDKMKSEMYKVMGKSQVCLRALRRVMDGVLDQGEVKKEWKESKT